MSLISIIYNVIAIPLLSLVITFLKPFNRKLREREGNWEDILVNFKAKDNSGKRFRLWFHSASMGEFEQAKPIIEKLKKNNPEIYIIVSFYSPSGFNNQKNYKFADAVLYMPFDSRANSKYFIRTIKPDAAVFIRYEIWRNHLDILHKKKIPALLVCATKPTKKYLYECFLIRPFTKSNYSYFKKIFTVSLEHTDFFNELKIPAEIKTLSDTRFDRIIENVEINKEKKLLPSTLFPNRDFLLVTGSTWEPDEDLIIEVTKQIEKENIANLRLIIVPHEPTENHIKKLKNKLPNSFLLSQIEEFLRTEKDNSVIAGFLGKNHIIVDSIGKLLSLYSIANAAYIGGAFGAGVHSVTEPAGYGLPLSCGPKMTNSPDAIKLESYGSLNVISNSDTLFSWLKKIITNDIFRLQAGMLNRDYIFKFKGSSDVVVKDIEGIISSWNDKKTK
ncbi:MAG: glycosyltransferase N-terminal domain-containing protein [bacterium]